MDIGIEGKFSVTITDCYVAAVEVRNTFTSLVILPKGFLLRYIKDLNKQGYYTVSPAKLKSWIRSAIRAAVGIIIAIASYYPSTSKNAYIG